MGKGFWIIVHEGFGSGLNLKQPQLLNVDGNNWWSYNTDEERETLVAELTKNLGNRLFEVVEYP